MSSPSVLAARQDPARSVRESNPCFITTDPGLQLSRMTATTNNGSWTTTFQDDGNDEQQIPEPCGPPVQNDP